VGKMLRTGLFIMTIGFVALISGFVSDGDNRMWTFLFAAVFIIGGYYMHSKSEKDTPEN